MTQPQMTAALSKRQASAALAMAAGVLCMAPAAAAQFWIDFEPPEYSASPAGEPLAGQDGWEVVSGSGEAWRVHTSGHGLPPAAGQFIAAHSSAGPAMTERTTEGIARTGRLSLSVAVGLGGGTAAAPEIGSWSLEPRDESAGFGVLALWNDPAAPVNWRLEVAGYAADGSRQRFIIPGAEALETGRWYEVSFTVRSYSENQIEDVWIRLGAGDVRSYKPVDWYLAGGATGGLPTPTRVAVESALAPSADAVLATNRVIGRLTSYEAYADCNHDGRWDFFDYLCFQEAFVTGAPWADCDGSGTLDFFDFLCFQDSF